MKKTFKKITVASSNEVSLCSKYNSGANKQTQFELVKDKDNTNNTRDIKPVIEELIKYCEVECSPQFTDFKDFLNQCLEDRLNNAYYSLLNEALMNKFYEIQFKEVTKEQKEAEFKELFNDFITEFNNLPITKNANGRYEVSLVSKSHTKEQEAIPQNETEDITKEKTGKMGKEEQLNVIQKAFDAIKSVLGLEKTETPSEKTAEPQPKAEETVETVEKTEDPVEPVVEETVEETVEKTEEPTETAEEVVEATEEPADKADETVEEVEEPVKPAEEETPVVTEEVKEEEKEEAKDEPAEEVVEETVEKTEEQASEEIAKSTSNLMQELEEMKKAKEEAETKIEKMSFVQKAKDEFSMLVGTPEEIGEKLYSISKSNLETEVKDFVMEQLKKVSEKNSELTQEVGTITKGSSDMTEEEITYAKAEELAKAKGISINKALRQIK